MKDKTISAILEDKLPGLTGKACEALTHLMESGDLESQKTAINGLAKLMPFVVAKKQAVEVKVEGSITHEAENALQGWLNERRNAAE